MSQQSERQLAQDFVLAGYHFVASIAKAIFGRSNRAEKIKSRQANNKLKKDYAEIQKEYKEEYVDAKNNIHSEREYQETIKDALDSRNTVKAKAVNQARKEFKENK